MRLYFCGEREFILLIAFCAQAVCPSPRHKYYKHCCGRASPPPQLSEQNAYQFASDIRSWLGGKRMHIGNLITLGALIVGGFAWGISGFFGVDVFAILFRWTSVPLEYALHAFLVACALWQLIIFPRAIRTGVSDTQANIVRHP
ncbi:hypothetical protein [Rhizobium wenxiniae]|uniref:hypothetical protein n=1 Tax=Rhizobium wenxiniae TaxID=1737357 RepID=UPI003C23FFB8